jgi:hypothetical protein
LSEVKRVVELSQQSKASPLQRFGQEICKKAPLKNRQIFFDLSILPCPFSVTKMSQAIAEQNKVGANEEWNPAYHSL